MNQENLLHQAHVAFQKYLERGESALKEFKLGNLELGLIFLKRRNAAFQNFKVAETLLNEKFHMTSIQEKQKNDWEQIIKINTEIEDFLKNSKQESFRQLQEIPKLKLQLKKFLSGNFNEGLAIEQGI